MSDSLSLRLAITTSEFRQGDVTVFILQPVDHGGGNSGFLGELDIRQIPFLAEKLGQLRSSFNSRGLDYVIPLPIIHRCLRGELKQVG